jgi:nitroimidazol reductase NimA-like FMN-containing flavoprotein (pyridoxamine 5'-phosphate oxidase superfamily)
MMEQHDIDAELNTPGAQELLSATSAAHLAYVGTDATPRVIPVGFWWTGQQFVISTATTSPKVAALSARPDVALAIDTAIRPARRGRYRCAGGRRSRSWTGWSRNT